MANAIIDKYAQKIKATNPDLTSVMISGVQVGDSNTRRNIYATPRLLCKTSPDYGNPWGVLSIEFDNQNEAEVTTYTVNRDEQTRFEVRLPLESQRLKFFPAAGENIDSQWLLLKILWKNYQKNGYNAISETDFMQFLSEELQPVIAKIEEERRKAEEERRKAETMTKILQEEKQRKEVYEIAKAEAKKKGLIKYWLFLMNGS